MSTTAELKIDELWQGLLEGVPDEQISSYACKWLDLKSESSLDDFEEYEIVKYLEGNDYDFSENIPDDELVDNLQRKGYRIEVEEDLERNLDIIDSNLLDEIIGIFTSATIHERQEIFDLIKNR